MAIEVHIVKRKVPAGKEAGKEKYYGQVRVRDRVSLQQLSEQVSADTSAGPGDVEAVIISLVRVVNEILEMGNVAELGDFGNLRLSASSKGVETKEEFKGWMMHSPRVIFTPGTALQHLLEDVTYEWMSADYDDRREPCPFPH